MNGDMAVIQNQCNPQIVKLMIAHLCNLMGDAVYHGWEPVKHTHSNSLSCLEMGEFSWFDKLKLAERGRSTFICMLKLKDGYQNNMGSKNFDQGQGRCQVRQFSNNY
jgi:hypothetical protein